MKTKNSMSILFVSVFLMVFLGQAVAQEKVDSKLFEVLKRGSIIVGVNGETPPYGFKTEKGELIGFDIDIAKLLAKSMFEDPSKIKFIEQSFPARIPSVVTDKVDVVIQGAAITPERLLKVQFTYNYYDSGEGILVRKEAKIDRISDLNDPKRTVALLNNVISLKRADQYFPKAKRLMFDSMVSSTLAVQTGRADAVFVDLVRGLYVVTQNPHLKVLPELIGSFTRNGWMLKPGDQIWFQYLNAIVVEMRHGYLYQEYDEIHKKWFGINAPPQNYYIEYLKQALSPQ